MAVNTDLSRMTDQTCGGVTQASVMQRDKDRFRAAIDAVRGVLWTNDATGRMVGEQHDWAALTGQDLSEYSGYGWAEAVHPDDRQPTIDAWDKAVAERRTFEFEHRVRRHDGCWRTFSIRAVPLVNAGDGSVREWVGVHTDVTEQREAETALQKAHAELDLTANEFRTFAEGMAELCWIAKPDGHIYWFNRRWHDYTGKSLADMEGWGWQSIHDPNVLPNVLDLWRAALSSGAPFEMTFPLRGADGVFRPFLTRITPVHGPNGTVQRWLGTNVDVSELKGANTELEMRVKERTADLERLARHLSRARDMAERANKAKTRFLAGMSHELRTPLNGILGYAQMLQRDGGLNDVQRSRVEAMLGAGNHLLQMITSVLNMSEIEAEHVALQVTEIDLPEVMEGCLDVIGAAAETKGLSLSLSTQRGAPRRLTTDPTRMRQIVLNLLGNAVKFTSKGSVELRLCRQPSGDGLRLEVLDTGPGIPAELRGRLFQDFERLDSRASAAIEGSGLGLALSARLATLLDGRLGHDDKPGGGSVFWLELPLTIAGAPSPCVTVIPYKPEPETTVRTLRILVVDDIAMNRDIAESFLSSGRHSVTCVGGGAEAVTAATNGYYDVILMDVRMPEMDGLEATRHIRRLPGQRGRVPIIGVTAQAFAEQVADCTEAGMNAHVPKPFSQEALLKAVAAFAQWADTSPPAESAPAALSFGTVNCEKPLLDPAQFKSVAVRLSSDRISAALETIVARGESLLPRLAGWEAGSPCDDEIADDIHTLAGSAGMFGFARVADSGQRFEHAIRTGAAESATLAASFFASIEATCEHIRQRPQTQ